MNTHETFVQAVADLAIARYSAWVDVQGGDELAKGITGLTALTNIKLVYGSGPSGTRGVTFFNRWKRGADAAPFVEISAFGQESWVQVAGTTIHELGHVLAGWKAGHGPLWKEACGKLGLRKIKAAGTCYCLANFDPTLRLQIATLPKPDEGEPVCSLMGPGAITMKPCGAGIGVRGGKSRGPKSGSRLRLWTCSCGCKVRVASDTFEAVHTPCGETFKRS